MSINLTKALIFAVERHGDQKHSGRPYVAHLLDVIHTLQQFGFNGDEKILGASEEYLLIAAALHDVVEDTDTEIEEVSDLFGADIGIIVGLVTDKPGKNRAERHDNTYSLIRGNYTATTVKVADRIANVERSMVDGSDFLGMYKKEYLVFRKWLYQELSVHQIQRLQSMWNHLDDLMEFPR